ncbi:hypothetical protein AB2N08_03065 [Massilia aurea]|uniref:hypothetical protein n=1 Tax=Massilia aurea TaxID=373040 RepID=UPI003462277A
MTLHVHIERLVVDASLGLELRVLEAALAEGLAQALQQPGLPLLQQDGRIGILHGDAFRFDHRPASWSGQFAGALRGPLASTAAGGKRSPFPQRETPA